MAMPAHATSHYWTAAEVRALIDAAPEYAPRYELLNGELLVTPAPAPIHQLAVTELLVELTAYVDRQSLGVVLTSPSDLELERDQITQPDLFVAPFGEPVAVEHELTWKDVGAPLLAVEVISPSSVRTDRVGKRDHYMSPGVPEYWVVDVDARIVEQWRPERPTPVVATRSLTWSPTDTKAALTIDLPALFDRVWSKARRLAVR